jgi:Na+-transporting NADH:ubiquinone oxidoreductase subunit NqrB
MKTLKILRPIFLAAGLVCLLVALFPKVMVQGKVDWLMTAMLLVCIAAFPATYVNHTRKERNTMYLSSTDTKMMVLNLCMWTFFMGYSAYTVIKAIVAGIALPWPLLACVFVGLYGIVNSIVIIKAKISLER